MSFFKAVKKNSNEGRGWRPQGIFCTFKMLFHKKVLSNKFRQSLAQSLNFSVYEKFCLMVIAKCRRLVFLSSSFWLVVNQWGVSFWHGSSVVKSTKIGIEIYATKFSIVVEGISFIRSTCWTCPTGRWWCGRRRSWGRLKVLWGKRFVGASKQAKPKQKLVVEGSEKKDDNQEFFDAEIRRRTGPIGSLLPTSRSLVCFSSRARGFSRATSFSAPMIKIGNMAVQTGAIRIIRYLESNKALFYILWEVKKFNFLIS